MMPSTCGSVPVKSKVRVSSCLVMATTILWISRSPARAPSWCATADQVPFGSSVSLVRSCVSASLIIFFITALTVSGP